jgi:hypothetical protein
MQPDYRTMVKTMTNSIIANQGVHHAVGSLEAFLYMVLEDMPQDKAEPWVKLINQTTEDQG